LIGEKIRQFHSISKGISDKALKVTKNLSGEDYKTSVEKLKSIFDSIFLYLSEVQNKFDKSEDSLSEIVHSLEEIVNEGSGFKKLVRHLEVQGIAIKIESARLGNNGKDFNVLAENINGLAQLIANKSKGFIEKTKLLVEIGKNAKKQIWQLEIHENEVKEKYLENTRASTDSLLEKYKSGSLGTGLLNTKIESIRKDISSLVSAVQFHDITRQQIEQVVKAVKNLIDKTRQFNDLKQDITKDKELITYIYEACRLQIAHLENSKDELTKAVDNIISNLEGIENEISEITLEILRLLECDDNECAAFIEKVNLGLTKVVSALSENETVGNEFSSSVEKVVTTVESLSEFINEISNIGSEIELISLNASIKAAHTGKEGVALGILAESTQKLSIDSKRDTGTVIDKLIGVMELSKKLQKSEIDKSTDSGKLQLKTISEEIKKTFTPLEIIVNDAVSDSKFIKSRSGKIEMELSQAINSLRNYMGVYSQIDKIINQLEAVVNESSHHIDKSLIHTIHLDHFKKNYTMEVQRDIHNTISSGNIKAGGNSIKGTITNNNDSASNGFGNNVELF
jgi:methyl-accepting chemotaxis protein